MKTAILYIIVGVAVASCTGFWIAFYWTPVVDLMHFAVRASPYSYWKSINFVVATFAVVGIFWGLSAWALAMRMRSVTLAWSVTGIIFALGLALGARYCYLLPDCVSYAFCVLCYCEYVRNSHNWPFFILMAPMYAVGGMSAGAVASVCTRTWRATDGSKALPATSLMRSHD